MPITKGTIAKKSTPKVVGRTPKDDYVSKEGKPLYKYFVEMENGDKGSYASASATEPKFVKGVEVEYFLDVMTSEKSSDWKGYQLRYNSPDNGFKKGGYKKKTPEEQKSICYNVVHSSCLDLFIECKKLGVSIPEENKVIASIYYHIVSLIFKEGSTTIESDCILYCSAVKLGLKQMFYKLLKNPVTAFSVEDAIKLIDQLKAKLNYDNFKTKTDDKPVAN